MIHQSGHGMTFSHTFDEEVARVQQIDKAIDDHMEEILEAIGIQVLSWMQDDYKTKARGETDPAGVKWDPIKRSSMRSRLRKLQSYREKTKADKRTAIDQAMASHEIGVDTGRLINSLEFSTDNPSDTQLTIKDHTVTVGSAVKYADDFDSARPIFSEKNITEDRRKELDELVEDIVDDIINNIIK